MHLLLAIILAYLAHANGQQTDMIIEETRLMRREVPKHNLDLAPGWSETAEANRRLGCEPIPNERITTEPKNEHFVYLCGAACLLSDGEFETQTSWKSAPILR